ncbi:unnamed protein product [Pleuronectes platessa]|uniref:Uncharacterized protein n=1 Tax=Pleuronectes platessa TaxID=8262 RepID=A0A9N7V958_PLEPL|nr:unnamed protein product [Pleuronectes platessa]
MAETKKGAVIIFIIIIIIIFFFFFFLEYTVVRKPLKRSSSASAGQFQKQMAPQLHNQPLQLSAHCMSHNAQVMLSYTAAIELAVSHTNPG